MLFCSEGCRVWSLGLDSGLGDPETRIISSPYKAGPYDRYKWGYNYPTYRSDNSIYNDRRGPTCTVVINEVITYNLQSDLNGRNQMGFTWVIFRPSGVVGPYLLLVTGTTL